jgi:quercetin dioxygenase-like cupin family protein
MVSGRIKVVMDDGSEEFGPGDTDIVPPGHNRGVVGNERVVGIDFTGLKDYGKGRRATSTVGLIEKRREKRLDSDRPEIS